LRKSLLTVTCAALLALPAAALRLQQPGDAAEIEHVEQMIDEALAALRDWNRAGGTDGAPDHPAHQWAARLWEYHQQNPGTRAASLAAAEALHQWVHAGALDRVYAEARALPPDDPAWDRVVDVLGEASVQSGDDSALREIAEGLLPRATDAALVEKLRKTLGQLYLNSGETARARAHFQAIVDAPRPDSRAPVHARAALYRIDHLSAGAAAPGFTAPSTAGREISLAALRGHPVLIIFWASW
jgi:hypothetical protein